MKGWMELGILVIVIALLCRIAVVVEQPGAQSAPEPLEPTVYSYESPSSFQKSEPKQGTVCEKRGGHRLKIMEDCSIMMVCGWPSGLGDHPWAISGLYAVCQDCGCRRTIRGSHWHPSKPQPDGRPFICEACRKACEEVTWDPERKAWRFR